MSPSCLGLNSGSKNTKHFIKRMKNKHNRAKNFKALNLLYFVALNIFQTCIYLHDMSYKQLAGISTRTMLIANTSAKFFISAFNFCFFG